MNFPKIAFCVLLLNCLQYQIVGSIRWLGLSQQSVSWDSRGKSYHCRLIRRTQIFAKNQVRICRTSLDVMPHIVQAANIAKDTCGNLFQNRRWNCSSIYLSPKFTPDLTTGTREQAFVYGISSAALVYAISKACSSGGLFNCSCAQHPNESPNGNFKWGGCGDNIRWAIQFSKQFTDTPEKKLLRGKTTPKTKRGSTVPTPDLHVVMASIGMPNSKVPSKSNLAAINLHNNRAGRKAIEALLRRQCKCHGVSGSCSVKICWKALPTFYEIGERLQEKYGSSIKIRVRKNGMESLEASRSTRQPTTEDLIYITNSPDYCLRDDRTGSLGTRGRYCNATSKSYDSCESLCCGRNYTTLKIPKHERCDCKFQWCCDVICNKCLRWVDTHLCN